MKKALIYLLLTIFSYLPSFSQNIDQLSISESIDFINSKLKNNPPDTISYFEIDVNYYGQLIVLLHQKPYLNEISTFTRIPIKNIKMSLCQGNTNQLTFSCNTTEKCVILYTEIKANYTQAFVKFNNSKGDNCELMRKAFEHLFQLILVNPLYQEHENIPAPKKIEPASEHKSKDKAKPATKKEIPNQKKTPSKK